MEQKAPTPGVPTAVGEKAEAPETAADKPSPKPAPKAKNTPPPAAFPEETPVAESGSKSERLLALVALVMAALALVSTFLTYTALTP